MKTIVGVYLIIVIMNLLSSKVVIREHESDIKDRFLAEKLNNNEHDGLKFNKKIKEHLKSDSKIEKDNSLGRKNSTYLPTHSRNLFDVNNKNTNNRKGNILRFV